MCEESRLLRRLALIDRCAPVDPKCLVEFLAQVVDEAETSSETGSQRIRAACRRRVIGERALPITAVMESLARKLEDIGAAKFVRQLVDRVQELLDRPAVHQLCAAIGKQPRDRQPIGGPLPGAQGLRPLAA